MIPSLSPVSVPVGPMTTAIGRTAVSDGHGNPCRSCLADIRAGAAMLIVAARPFPALQPYAETGPIFLCAADCTPWSGPGLPRT